MTLLVWWWCIEAFVFSVQGRREMIFLGIFCLCGFFANDISLEVGLTIQQCITKLVRLEAFHLPLANHNDNALGTHLTRGLDCKLCSPRASGRAAAKESSETLWTDLSSILALLYFGAISGLLCICSWITIHDTQKPSNYRKNLFQWPLPTPQHCAEEARQQL